MTIDLTENIESWSNKPSYVEAPIMRLCHRNFYTINTIAIDTISDQAILPAIRLLQTSGDAYEA